MATRVNIPIALERAIRREVEKGAGSPLVDLVKILDEAQKRAAGSIPGLGYKELVALFRSALGPDLAVPMNPSVGYIARLVNKAKELGIVKENVEQIARGVRAKWRAPYSLDFVVNRADIHYAAGEDSQNSGDIPIGGPGKSGYVFSGRPDDD